MNNSLLPATINIDKDAWIVCDSRSHPGLKYYVNKVTGIKVWNITDSEIAFAEKLGKVGPEPSGSPKMNSPTDQANILKTQMMNNQFPNQLSNMVLTSPGNPFQNWENHQGQPVNMQQQFYNSQGQPMNMQQQFYALVPATAISPLLNQGGLQNYPPMINQGGLQNYQYLAQTTSLHNNAPFIPQQEQYGQNQRTPIKRSFNSFNHQNKDWHEEQYHRQESTFEPLNDIDLRSKITRRRRKSCSGSFVYNDHDFPKETSTKRITYETKNKVEPVIAPTQSKSKLKLTPLKTLTATNSEFNQWYIVVEKDMILQNYNFLDDLVTADPDCRLVVPHHVMSELRTHVSVTSDVRPRRTLRFLDEQIKNGIHILGEPEDGSNSSHNTVLTCVKLATNKNIVILITDNKETLALKPNINGVHVFTMRTVKDILEKKYTKPSPASPTMAIKIVVPNNLNKEKETREPTNNMSSELFGHYGNYDQSSFNNETLHTPPTQQQQNCKMVSRIMDRPRRPATPHAIRQNSPILETKKISQEITQSTLETNLHNNSKINDKNLHKPKMTNTSLKEQEMSTQRSPDNNYNSSSSSKFDGNNLLKEASSVVAPQISPTPTTQANINAVVEEDASRGSATFIAPTDPNNSNFHHKNEIKRPSESNNSPHKHSPSKPEFASPRKINNSYWNQTGNKNIYDTIDSSSNSSTSNISLDSIMVKKIISMNKLNTATSKGQIVNAEEITPLIVRPNSPFIAKETSLLIVRRESPSSWASYDNTPVNSEGSLTKTVGKNLVVAESSTSEVSNSESFNSSKVVKNPPKKQDVKRVSRRRKVVMYDVACQSMEEVLRLRSEEWVFRFVQIMEEVLRVKLQEKIPYEHKEPAPWNLQEAARCIIKKFDSHFDVVDAANKLARFLYETSDENGKILNIEPSDYMELYSYGVFLVETFLDMCTECKEKDCIEKKTEKQGFSEEKCSCHEVGTASELLKKLLFDIHNANVETFVDQEVDPPPDYVMDSSVDDSAPYDYKLETGQQSATEVVKLKMNEMKIAENVERRKSLRRKHPDKLDEVTPNAKKTKASLNSPQLAKTVDKAAEADDVRKVQKNVMAGKRLPKKTFLSKLRLTKNVNQNKKNNGLCKKADVKVPPKDRNVTMDTSSDSAFFSSLQHDKKDLNNADKLKACKITVVCSNKPDAPDEQKNPPRSSPEELIGLKCHFSNENEKSPSKVVRTFKINEEIERRVKAKQHQKEYEDPHPNVKYNEAQDSIRTVDNTLDIDGSAANETYERISVDDKLYERTINGNYSSKEDKFQHKIIEAEANATLYDEMKHISLQLERVFIRVMTLCKTYVEEKMQSGKCTETLRCKVNTAFTLLSGIHKALLKSANRENHYENKLKKLLKLEITQDYFADNRFSLQYRQFIARCTKPVEEILKNLRGILSEEDSRDDITT